MLKKVFFSGLALVCILAGIFVYNYTTYVGEVVDPLTYFDEFADNENNLVYEDKRVDLKEPVLIKDGQMFVRYRFANEYVNDIIFYDEQEKVMTLTNDRQIIKLYEGENQIEYAGVSGTYTLLNSENGLYISASLLTDLFGVSFEEGKTGSGKTLYVATDHGKTQKTAVIRHKAALRTHPQDKSTVLGWMKKGMKVYVYGDEQGFVRVRNEKGIIGLVKASDIGHESEEAAKKLPEAEKWESNPLGRKVKLVWDQMTTRREVNWTGAKYADITKANVIAPTWFEFGDEEGNLIDRGTSSYVSEAHKRNLEVWPVLSHSFENGELTQKILSSTTKRQKVINQIVGFAQEYGFDGINIDIENIKAESSGEWVEFMRELYPQMKSAGLKVSVDVYAPSGWSEHYERAKVSNSCDYFIVMAYDQHWSGSEEAGSVAELPWTEQGITASLEEVPAQKLVLGIPFYTRLWVETDNGLNTKSYDMESIQKFVEEWGVTPQMDEASGQNYAESVQSDGVYKVWIEDYTSVSKRVDLIEKYDLAGFGAWKLGLETRDIWNALDRIQ